MTKRLRAATGRPRPAAGRITSRATMMVASAAAVALGIGTAGSAVAAGTGASAGSDTVKRIGAAPRVPAGATVGGDTASGTKLHLSVNLSPRDPRALTEFVTAVSTPGSPLYHHYLAKGQFASTFGPTPAAIAQVSQALKAAGLAPGKVSADGLSIPVTATVDQASHAFGTGFRNVRLKDGKAAYLNTSAPALPAGVASSVTGVVGLSDIDTITDHITGLRHAHEAGSVGGSTSHVVAPHTYTPGLCSDFTGAGLTDGTDYYSPGKLAGNYGMTSSATAGAGQTVAVLELENVDDNSVAAYQNCVGTSTSVTHQYVDTTAGSGTAAGTEVDGSPVGVESALDIEDLIGLAPGASIVDYQGPDAANATDQNVLDIYQKMVTDDQAQVISTSWGECEPASASATLSAENTIFAEAAAQGQSVVAASGDDGSSDCDEVTGSTTNAVDDPASQPYVTGVGGTTMQGSGSTKTQTAWEYSGGGTSSHWAPTVYQGGIATTTKRAVPDVAALADPNDGYPIYLLDDSDSSSPEPGLVGGTSGAAPTWAAAIVQANASSTCQTNGRVGFLNDALYKAGRANYAGDFWDVTSGDNSAYATGYTAVTGYDRATGLGAPKESGLIASVCAAKGTAATGASTFHPLASPKRVLDTRYGTGWGLSSVPTKSALVAGGTAPVKIEGAAGIPSSGVTAVVLNLTVTGTTGSGSIIGWADGTTKPSTSNINWTGSGQTIAASATVKVGADGVVDLATNSATNVIADVQGYYTADTTGAKYTALKPARLLDTRNATGISTKTKITNAVVSLKVRGHGGVPSGATSVVLNLTATQTVGSGYLEAYPEGATRPTASNVNWSVTGTTIPNLAVVPIGSDGNVSIYVHGTSHVIADVSGYFSTSGSTFDTVTPLRLLDTRKTTALGSGQTLALPVSGADGIPSTGVKAVVLTVTVTGTTGSGYLTAWADGTSRPTASNLNWAQGKTVSNQVMVPVGSDGKVDFYTSSATNVLVDVAGYVS